LQSCRHRALLEQEDQFAALAVQDISALHHFHAQRAIGFEAGIDCFDVGIANC
jgi:hypothetical protein